MGPQGSHGRLLSKFFLLACRLERGRFLAKCWANRHDPNIYNVAMVCGCGWRKGIRSEGNPLDKQTRKGPLACDLTLLASYERFIMEQRIR